MTALAGDRTMMQKGFRASVKWLVLRRLSQISILILFLLGPWAGVWILKGNLSSSVILDKVPLTDPYLMLQSLVARHAPETTALTGAAIVLAFYLLVGGRAFCSWVCPINIVTDTAGWMRRRLNLKSGRAPFRNLRYWLLAATLAAAALTGSIVWELVNPVSMLHRGLIFGMGLGWAVVAAVFVFDMFVAPRGWCGHVCPMGAFYSVLGRAGLTRVAAPRRKQCDDCMDCFTVCPEPQVIRPALKGSGSTVITAGACTNCGRCIDVCHRDVFRFTHRFDKKEES